MSITNFTASLFLKPYKINQKGEAPIYVRILLEGKKYEISTNKRIGLTQWDQKHKKVYNSHTAIEDNRFLEAIVAKINNAYSKMYIANEKITIEKIKSFLYGDSLITMTPHLYANSYKVAYIKCDALT